MIACQLKNTLTVSHNWSHTLLPVWTSIIKLINWASKCQTFSISIVSIELKKNEIRGCSLFISHAAVMHFLMGTWKTNKPATDRVSPVAVLKCIAAVCKTNRVAPKSHFSIASFWGWDIYQLTQSIKLYVTRREKRTLKEEQFWVKK